jgi:8-oxo-dGTP pyrophosphatase MutT (NUDIX family)
MPKPSNPEKARYLFTDEIQITQKMLLKHPTEDAYLIIKLSPNDPTKPSQWDLPGGAVDYFELFEDAIEREVKEEVGLAYVAIRQLRTFSKIRPKGDSYDVDTYFIGIDYTATAVSDQVVLSSEHTEYQWVPKEQLASFFTRDRLQTMSDYL